MTLQRISLPNQELQAPLFTPEDNTRERSLQQQTVDERFFKYEYCHRADSHEKDRVSVLLCEAIKLGPPNKILYALDTCYQHNFTVESYINVVGHYGRQERAGVECSNDPNNESKQSFCTHCPLGKEPTTDFEGTWWGDERICNVEEQGCLPPYVFNLNRIPINSSILRCEDGSIGIFDSESDGSYGLVGGLMESCDSEYVSWMDYREDHEVDAKFHFPMKVNDHDFLTCSDFDSDGACPGFCQLVESASLSSNFVKGGRTYRTSDDREENPSTPFDDDNVGAIAPAGASPTNSLVSGDVHEEAGSSFLGGVVWSVICVGALVGMLVRRHQQSRQHSRHDGPPPSFASAFTVPPCEYQMVEQQEETTISQQ